MDQIAISGAGGYFGVPTTTVGWGTSYTQYTATVFSEIQKTMDADIDPTIDNSGERRGENRRNKRIQVRFSAHPIGTTTSVASPPTLPHKGDMVHITCATDAQVACDGSANTALVDDASARYTPEGECVIDFTITIWLAKVFVALT